MRIGDNLFMGRAYAPDFEGAFGTRGPSPQTLGVGPMGRTYTYDIVPLTLQTAGLAALQTTAGAGNFTLTAGTGVTATVDPTGTTRYVLDVPRAVTLTSAGNISAVTFTITGYCSFGNPMTQTLAGPNANTVATTKAFKSITSVAVSGAVGTNTSVGFNDKFGLPIAVSDAGYLVHVGWAGALARDAGTFVAADATTATSTTGDTRGTYTPSSAANGSRRLAITIACTELQVGPTSTTAGAFGVTQA